MQRLRAQLARACHRVAVRRQRDGLVRHPARGGLEARSFGLVGQAVALTGRAQAGQPGHQRRLGQALQINDRVVGVLLQLELERPPGASCLSAERRFAPAPQITGDDAVDAATALCQRRKATLHHPVDLRVRQGAQDVLHRRHGVHHVAKR